MNKNFKKTARILLSIFIVTIITICFSSTIFAASQDGINVTINSDKLTFSADETAKITVTVENTNDFEVKNVTIEHIIPAGLKQIGTGNLKETKNLAANEKVDIIINIERISQGNTGNNGNNSSNNNDNNINNNTNGNNSNPQTMDANILFSVILLIFGAAAIFFLIKYRKKSAGIFSILLILALVTALPVNILAAGNTNNKSFETVKTFTVGGASYQYKVVVSYPASSLPEPTPEVPNPLILDLTNGKNASYFAGMTPKTQSVEIVRDGRPPETRIYEGVYLRDVLTNMGVTSFIKVEYNTGDGLSGEISFSDFDDILLAWSRTDGNTPSAENPIRICPKKDSAFGNELIQQVIKLTITIK